MEKLKSLTSIVHPLHREGWPFVVIFAVVTLLLFLLWVPLGWLGAVATVWCVYFFRDPDRVTPLAPGLVVAPADGLVVHAGEKPAPFELGLAPEPRHCVSIFMNVFDVHVNRSPIDATVDAVVYTEGAFVNASLDKASEKNERNGLRLALRDGRDLGVVQIAGLVARRIVCYAAPGTVLATGERFGIIRFGSRVDVYLPPGVVPLVAVGQRTLAGETVIADLDGPAVPRPGIVR